LLHRFCTVELNNPQAQREAVKGRSFHSWFVTHANHKKGGKAATSSRWMAYAVVHVG
jgi:hypothetical protein